MTNKLVQNGKGTAGTSGGGVNEDRIHIINFQIAESIWTLSYPM